jgi:hypothetical protein
MGLLAFLFFQQLFTPDFESSDPIHSVCASGFFFLRWALPEPGTVGLLTVFCRLDHPAVV